MKTLRHLLVAATIALSPVLHAAETFVAHYEPLRDVMVRAGETEFATVDAKLPRSVALSFEALGQRFDLDRIALTESDLLDRGWFRDVSFTPAGLDAARGRLSPHTQRFVRMPPGAGPPATA